MPPGPATDQTVFLMDASAFIHRSFHALRRFATRRGEPTGAAFGFTNTVIRLLKDKSPRYLGVVYDSRGKTRRHLLYPEYKANRPPMDPDLASQIPAVKGIVEALGLYSLEQPGFEADDVIAAYARRFESEGHEVVIVSADKDFYQLLSGRVSMYDPDPARRSAMTLAGFAERFEGLSPAQFLDCQALMGDASDNIPGVPKVGEKTALKLIREYRSLDALYGSLERVTPPGLRDKLRQNEESARLSRRLALLGEDCPAEAPLAAFLPRPRDREALRKAFLALEFQRLLDELGPEPPAEAAPGAPGASAEGATGASAEGGPGASAVVGTVAEAGAEGGPAGGAAGAVVDYSAYVLVSGEDAWRELEGELRQAGHVAVDVETDSRFPSSCGVVGVSLATGINRAFYIPVGHSQDLFSPDVNQDREAALRRLAPYLTDPAKSLYGQNAKFDWLVLARFGLRLPPPAGDPMLAAYLADPDGRAGLDHLSLRYLNHAPRTYAETVGPGRKTFREVDPRAACEYSAEDADLTLRLAPLTLAALQGEPALTSLYREVELPLEDLLVSMEQAGIRVDPLALAAISEKLGETLAALQERIWEGAGTEFNVSSPKQVGEVLFGKLGLPAGKRTAKKTGWSTDSEVLSDLAAFHPVAGDILLHRETSKLKTTYADRLPLAVNPATGRIHTVFHQIFTATGRLSSSDPNLQNIPAKTEEGRRIRECFVADEGCLLISADYSQIELRVMAEFSGDGTLMEAFRQDADIHRETAAAVFGKSPAEVTPEERSRAKAINFGIIYGQGPFGLARALKIPQGAARDFIETYFRRFPGVKAFMERIQREAARSGEVRTLFGRRRILQGFSSGTRQARAEAERMAVNTPVQGTAADVIKIAMLRAGRRLAREAPEARLLLQVHDELIAEAPEAEAEKVTRILREEMTLAGSEPFFAGAPVLKVPLKVDSVASRTWTHA
ncbi:MAG: DNA polymerase I [Deltaproteobacteria bacterium]|jgi:DNA polymerase-1|nr:DNA polymerase I [Deltaproteobacteria bacterium]